MHEEMLGLLRCPFCGTAVSLVANDGLVRAGDRIEWGVLGCECCAFPIVAGIPVMLADDDTRAAMHALEAGRREEALFMLLGLQDTRAGQFRALLTRPVPATYRDAIAILSPNAEGTYFVYRFSDPTFLQSQAIVQALGQQPWTVAGRVLDLCGGTGHLTRVLTGLKPAGGVVATGTVLADVYFWKLWLAARFTSPECAPVCCDANQPLPFLRDTFSMLVLLDAFPYIWHRRLLAEEMMRLVGTAGVVVLPHLHSSLGENFAAGMALSPAAYRNLFAPLQPRMFSDEKLLAQVLERRAVDLTGDVSPADLGSEPSLTLVASLRDDVFRKYEVPDALDVTGELKVNPLYRVERRGDSSVLTLTFPTPEYEEEFGACKRYMPATVTVKTDLSGTIDPSRLRPDYDDLRRRRVLIDTPPRYC
jgi:uncharacterized protein YbaR (Trm112 family)/SAM-dependent methyltransferase